MKTKENLDITRQLTRLDVDIIQADLPASSDSDFEAVKLITKVVENVNFDHVPLVCGLARCNKREIDRTWEAVKFTKQDDNGQLNLTGECLYNKHKYGRAENSAPPIGGKESGATWDVSSILDINKNAPYVSKEPNINLILKRLKLEGVQNNGESVQVDRCVRPCPEQSALSRYNAASNNFKAPNEITGSRSLIGHQTEAANRGQVSDLNHMTFKVKMIPEHVIEKGRNLVVYARRMGTFCYNVLSFPPNYSFTSSRDLKFAKHIHDNVHGSIYLYPNILKFIDTGQFRRLYDLTQLRMTHMVYPGIIHSRFEHSLEVYWLTSEAIHKLKMKEENELDINHFDTQTMKLAEILHNIIHGSYSHLFELEFLPKVINALECFHEQMSVEMVGHIVDVGDAVFPVLKGVSILKILVLGIIYVQNVKFAGLPSIRAIDMVVRSLTQIGAITMKNDVYELTVRGWEMVKLGIEPCVSKIILEYACLCLGREGLVLAALMENYSSIFCKFSMEIDKLKSDCLKELYTLVSFCKKWNAVPRENKNIWCWENKIDAKFLRRCRETLLELEACLKNNEAMHSGCDHLGYEVALRRKALKLHLACSLLNSGQRLVEVVFGVMLSSSNEYLVSVTSCDFEYLSTLSSSPRFDFLNMPLLKKHIGAGDRVTLDLPPLDEAGQVLLFCEGVEQVHCEEIQLGCWSRLSQDAMWKDAAEMFQNFLTFSHEVMAVNGGWFVMEKMMDVTSFGDKGAKTESSWR